MSPSLSDRPPALDDLEPLFRRFEDAWCDGPAPSVEAYLAAAGERAEARARAAVGLAQIDLEYRWAPSGKANGADRRLVEDYLGLFPGPGVAPETLAELIAAEYRVRVWAGERPTRDEYARRFGTLPDGVSALFTQSDPEAVAHVPWPPPAAAEPTHPVPPPGEFREALLRLGLIGPDEPAGVDHAGAADPEPTRDTARRLVQLGRLTRFQADRLLRGRGGELALGPYLLEARLGEGGSGRVFRARHRPTGQVVALKVFRDDLLGDLDAAGVARFRQEVEAAGRLDHPHVVRSLGAGTAGGVNFLAMEHLDGTDLGRLVVNSGPLPPAQASEFVRQAALALQHLADRGLVHRDVKPPNLFATGVPAVPRPGSWGVVKLLDVGFARLPLAETAPLTRTGDFLGTPDYLAPEQAADPHAADVRADLYGLGCTWFYLLTGRPPFAGGTFVQKIDRHRTEPPPDVRRFRPDVPPEVAAVLGRLLAKRPEDRPASPAELVADLTDLAARGRAGGSDPPVLVSAGQEPPTRPAALPPAAGRPRWNRRLVALAAGVAVVFAGATAALVLSRGEPPANTAPDDPRDPNEELLALEARERDGTGDREALRADLRAFRRTHFGTPAAERAAGLLFHFPSPLDRLPAGPLPTPAALAAGRDDLPALPAGLVAVLGTVGPKHWGAVTVLGLDPGGRTLASGGAEGAVILWDAATGAARRTLLGHAQAVLAVAVRPDGRAVCSGGVDGSVRLWDAGTGKLLRLLEPPGLRRISAVAFAPDGRTVAAAGTYPRFAVKLWDTHTGGVRRELVGHTGAVEALRFHPGGSRLASAGTDGVVRLWDVGTGREAAVLACGTEQIRDLAFRPDGAALAVAGDGAVQVWDAAAARRVWALPQPGLVRTVAFHPDGRTLAFACGGNAALTLCAADTGRDVHTLTGHGDIVTGAVFTADGRVLVSSSRDGTLKWWDAATGRERADLPRQHGDVDMVGFRDDGEVLVSASKDGVVKFWETARAAELRSVVALPAVARSVAMSWDGQALACGGWDGRIKVWEVATGRQLLDIAAHDGWVVRLAFSPDGRTLLSAGVGEPPVMKLWDAATGRAVRTVPVRTTRPRTFLRDALFGGSGDALASLTSEGVVQLWETATGRETHTLSTGPGSDFCAFALSPAARLGVFGASDGTVSVWDPVSGTKLRSWAAHEGAVSAAAFRPNGRVFATAGTDGLVRLWDADTAALRHEVRIGPRLGRIHQLAFGVAGRHLATANGNGTAYILQVPLGR